MDDAGDLHDELIFVGDDEMDEDPEELKLEQDEAREVTDEGSGGEELTSELIQRDLMRMGTSLPSAALFSDVSAE